MPAAPPITIAVDFGTACSAIALREKGSDDPLLYSPSGTNSETISCKTPSDLTIIYDPAVQQTPAEIVSDPERCFFASTAPPDADKVKYPGLVTFHGYKMALYPEEGKPDPDFDHWERICVEGSDHRSYPLYQLLCTFFRKIRIKLERSLAFQRAECIVVTVPAMAKSPAKDFMRAVVTEVFETQAATRNLPVVIVTEPDAALNSILNDRTLGEAMQLAVGEPVALLDIGGGTSDFLLSVVRQRKPLVTESLIPAGGGSAGGWNVDLRFLEVMNELFPPGADGLETAEYVSARLLDRFFSFKHTVTDDYTLNLELDQLGQDCMCDDATAYGAYQFISGEVPRLNKKYAALYSAETQKGELPPAPKDGLIQLLDVDGQPLPENADEGQCDSGLLRFTDEFMRAFIFNPVVAEVVRLAKGYMDRVMQACPTCKRIQLVGGFTQCKLLYTALCQAFSATSNISGGDPKYRKFTVRATRSASLAIVKGASYMEYTKPIPGARVNLTNLTVEDGVEIGVNEDTGIPIYRSHGNVPVPAQKVDIGPVVIRPQTELYCFEVPRFYDDAYRETHGQAPPNRDYPISLDEFNHIFSFSKGQNPRLASNVVVPIFQWNEKLSDRLASRVFKNYRPYSEKQTEIEVVVHQYPLGNKDNYIASSKPYAKFVIKLEPDECAVPYEKRTFEFYFHNFNGFKLHVTGPTGKERSYPAQTGEIVTRRQQEIERMRMNAHERTFIQMLFDPKPQHNYMVLDRSGSMSSRLHTFRTYPETHGVAGPNGITVFATVTEWVADYLSVRREVSSDVSQERLTLATFTTYHSGAPLIRWEYVDSPIPTASEFLSKKLDTDEESCCQDFDATLLEMAQHSRKRSQPGLNHCAFFLSDGIDQLKQPQVVGPQFGAAGFDYFLAVGFGLPDNAVLNHIATTCKGEMLYVDDAHGLREMFGFEAI